MTTFIELKIGDTIQYTELFEVKTSKIEKITQWLPDYSQLYFELADGFSFNHYPYNEIDDLDLIKS